MKAALYKPDPTLDLSFERVVDVAPELIWKAWTTPKLILKWFTPAPWKTIDCEIDLRPGGIFRTTMLSPEGKEYPNTGCYLELVENERLVWTDALEPGFRPTRRTTDSGIFTFTAVVSMAKHARGTRYSALAMHRSEADRKVHFDMGFEEGWGKALDQLLEAVKG